MGAAERQQNSAVQQPFVWRRRNGGLSVRFERSDRRVRQLGHQRPFGALEGEAEIWVEKEKIIGTKWKSVLIPPGYWHGFRNIGQGTLHMRAILAAPIFEASYEDRTEVGRRWVPEHKPA